MSSNVSVSVKTALTSSLKEAINLWGWSEMRMDRGSKVEDVFLARFEKVGL